MKKKFLFAIVLVLLSLNWRSDARISPTQLLAKRHYYSVTSNDRKNYILKIDQDKIIVQPDKVLPGGKRYGFIIVPLSFLNQSNESLKYLNYTCDWATIYVIDNKNIRIPGINCDSNFATVFEIPAHKRKVINVPLIFFRDSFLMTKFRIGIILQKDMVLESVNAFQNNIEALRKDTIDRIWSNTVQIPRNHF